MTGTTGSLGLTNGGSLQKLASYPSRHRYPELSSSHFSMRNPISTKGHILPLNQVDAHQWPWRAFAFASDLGTVGYLVRQKALGTLGWLIALPYYIYALATQTADKKKEEFTYQVTANGVFPFLEAKLGSHLGERLGNSLYQLSLLTEKRIPMVKALGGFLALVALTPTVGDPLSQKIVAQVTRTPQSRGSYRPW